MSIQRANLDSSCDPSVMSCIPKTESSDRASRSYWDIYTDDRIPVLERAIGGALLPVALVGSFFGAGCGGTKDEEISPDMEPSHPDAGRDVISEDFGDNDLDNDTVLDSEDNCIPPNRGESTYNPDQVDTDDDAIGDVCEGPDTHGESIECQRVAINDAGQVVVSAIHYEGSTSPRLGTQSHEKSVRLYVYPDTNLVTPETIIDVESYGDPLSTTLHCNAKKTVDINNNGQVLACWNEEGIIKCNPASITPGSSAYGVTSGVVGDPATYDAGEQYSVGLSDNGSFVVAWDDREEEKVHARLYESDSSYSGGYHTHEFDFENAWHPDVFVRPSGEFVLATSFGSGSGVKVHRFLPNGDPLDGEITLSEPRSGLPGVSWNSANQIAVAHAGDSYSMGAVTVFDADSPGGDYSYFNQTHVSIPEPDDDGLVLVWGRNVSYQVSLSTTGEIAMGGMATDSRCAGQWFLAQIPADDSVELSIVDNRSCPLDRPDTSGNGFSMDANDERVVMVADDPYHSARVPTEVLQWNDTDTEEK